MSHLRLHPNVVNPRRHASSWTMMMPVVRRLASLVHCPPTMIPKIHPFSWRSIPSETTGTWTQCTSASVVKFSMYVVLPSLVGSIYSANTASISIVQNVPRHRPSLLRALRVSTVPLVDSSNNTFLTVCTFQVISRGWMPKRKWRMVPRSTGSLVPRRWDCVTVVMAKVSHMHLHLSEYMWRIEPREMYPSVPIHEQYSHDKLFVVRMIRTLQGRTEL